MNEASKSLRETFPETRKIPEYYILVHRRNGADSWKPSPVLYTKEEAQSKLFNYSYGNKLEWDIMKCVSVLASCHDDKECEKPVIVEESRKA